MAAYIERRRTRAAGWARRLGAFSLVLLLTAALSRRHGLLDPPDFLLVLRLVAGLAGLALLCAAHAFRRFWNDDDLGGRDLSAGIVFAMIALTPFVVFIYRAAAFPAIDDISTDAGNPPAFASVDVDPGSGVNAAAAAAAESETPAETSPALAGRRYDLPLDQVFDVARALVVRQGWIILRASGTDVPAGEVTIEAQAATPVLAFPVNIAIRVADEAGSTFVDMRAASPYGAYDLGDNAAVISDLLSELDTEIARRPEAAPSSE